MSREHTKKSSTRRLFFVLFIIFIVVVYYFYRLIIVQVVEGPELKKQAVVQWTKERVIPAIRGNIYDTTGKVLATNVTSFTVWIEPLRIKEKDEASIKLSPIVGMSSDEIYERMNSGDTVRKLKQWVTREEADAIKELGIVGISIVDGKKRYYPLDIFASDIIGFTNIDNEGLYGVEGYYDEYLAGFDGLSSIMTDAANRPLPNDKAVTKDPIDGYNLVLNIDEVIQTYAEEAAEMAVVNNKAKSASVIVMNPKTGAILAMSNKPDYNPNDPRKAPDEETEKEWSRLNDEGLQDRWYEMWRNYAINDIYEPGSTFKIVTASAALDMGVANLNSQYYCNGFIRDIPRVTLRCAKWYDPHGHQDFAESFANSCNVSFVAMARAVGKAGMIDYTKKFGFGDFTGIDMKGEQRGLLPSRGDEMKDVELATLSYGHGVAVTPIQMINAIAAIGNGGNLMVPRVVSKIVDNDGKEVLEYKPEIKNRAVSKETADHILDMLEKTVIEGTGKRAYIPGYRVGGKTGTAQKIINGKYEYNKYISSFGGIAPVDDPKLAILVIVDEPTGIFYGGTVAGPSVQHVIENALEYMEVPRKYTEKELENIATEIIVPDLVGLKIGEAGKLLKELGLKYTTQYEVFTKEAIVVSHYPEGDKIVIKDSIVDLYLDEGERDMINNHNGSTTGEISETTD